MHLTIFYFGIDDNITEHFLSLMALGMTPSINMFFLHLHVWSLFIFSVFLLSPFDINDNDNGKLFSRCPL